MTRNNIVHLESGFFGQGKCLRYNLFRGWSTPDSPFDLDQAMQAGREWKEHPSADGVFLVKKEILGVCASFTLYVVYTECGYYDSSIPGELIPESLYFPLLNKLMPVAEVKESLRLYKRTLAAGNKQIIQGLGQPGAYLAVDASAVDVSNDCTDEKVAFTCPSQNIFAEIVDFTKEASRDL